MSLSGWQCEITVYILIYKLQDQPKYRYVPVITSSSKSLLLISVTCLYTQYH